ncbi:MAG: wax ester/triacylglycerol synthase family O-acyltransferase [Candidatus Korobacteraceae bacterium]
MAEFQQSNSFSWGDALFLYVERPGQPLSIASVSIFEGAIQVKALRDFVESKLPLIPRYLQHVVFPPFNLGLPTWQFDPNFDIRNHIRQVTLRRGTESDLKALASEIVSSHLDRQRPLWDLTLVKGLEGNRTGLVVRIHHCLADGIAGVGVVNVLMDPSPVAPPPPSKPPVFQAPPKRDAGAQLLETLFKSYFSAVNGALTLHSEAMKIAQEALANPGGPLADLVNVMPELAAPAERLPFNVVCHGPQRFAWSDIPMADIKAIRESCGGTVNDVILTVTTQAFGRYAALRGAKLKGRSIRIVIPVNVRGKGDVSELGNRISFLPVTLPLDIRDPQKLFAFVRERMEYLKHARAAEFVGFAGGLFSTVPAAILAAIGPLASQLPLSLCNLICTNVPGPQIPLYLMGHKMLSWYPYVPIGGEMGVNCAILSYNGTAYFGFTCDVTAVPDPQHLEKFVTRSFAELLRSSRNVVKSVSEPAASEKPTRPKRKRPNRSIPLTGKKKRASGKASVTSPSSKTGQAKKPATRVSPVITKEIAQSISDSRPPETAPTTASEQESPKEFAVAGD